MIKKYLILILSSILILLFFVYSDLKREDKLMDIACEEPYNSQIEYLKNDKLSETETFEKYSINDIYTGQISELDLSDEKTNLYRTALRTGVKEQGVNFAGHYSIVNVGMTGWGNNYTVRWMAFN
jgi:hypothetical protein